MQNVSRPPVELKGYRDGLRLLIDPEVPINQIEPAVVNRMANLGDSLAGMTMNIDLGNRSLNDEELGSFKDFLNENYGLEINQILGEAYDDRPLAEKPQIVGVPTLHQEMPIPHPFPLMDEETRFIRHTLRSGQVERSLEGNMVLLGDVNPGAEVMAAGDIIVLGTLRGIAHAGALGNTSSIIFALNLLPTQLRIGRFITRPPSGKQRRRRKAEIAHVEGNAIVVKEFASGSSGFSG